MEADGTDSWKLSNIGGIGGADDMQARAEAAISEDSFAGAGDKAGLEVWRVEKFELERIRAIRASNLSLYSGDAYLVLKTEEDDEGAKTYNLHYWIGDEATQDEQGAVAYFAVALDDLLGQKPVQYRETQDEESELFHTYFGSVVYLKGGVASGFKKVEPESYEPRLLRMQGAGKAVKVKQVDMDAAALNNADVFILDLGLTVYQYNAPNASVFERRKAMEIVQQDLKEEREELELIIVDGDEELLANADFWTAMKCDAPASIAEDDATRSSAAAPPSVEADLSGPKALYKVSDDDGVLRITKVKADDTLSADDVNGDDVWAVAVDGHAFFYCGANASRGERVAVRMHTPALLEAMELPRFAPTAVVSPSQSTLWDAIFAA